MAAISKITGTYSMYASMYVCISTLIFFFIHFWLNTFLYKVFDKKSAFNKNRYTHYEMNKLYICLDPYIYFCGGSLVASKVNC